MALRFLVRGLILVSLAACDSAPRTLTSSHSLQKEVTAADAREGADQASPATIEVSAKFDKTPIQGKGNVGVVYYRVDISNPTATGLSVGAVYLQFEDEMAISIRKCRLQGTDISPFGCTPIRVEPGKVFTASSSCEFPISQIDLVREMVSLVDFKFMEQRD